MSKLPNDIKFQVLARLPIKSLVKFKIACKFWEDLISSKYFVDFQFKISSHNPILLIEILDPKTQAASSFIFVDQRGRFSEFSMEFPNDDRVKVRASCNGLLCCSSIKNRGVFYVCNPMTRDIKILPRTQNWPFIKLRPSYEAALVGLAFDGVQTSGFNVVAAGFYLHLGQQPQDQLICSVFDSEFNAWRQPVSPHFDTFTPINCNEVVFSSGSLHWLAQSYSYLLVFDLGDKSWRKIPLSDEIVKKASGARIYLLELEGSVSLIIISEVLMCTWNLVRGLWVLFDEVQLGGIGIVFPVMQNRDVVFFASVNTILLYRRSDKVWTEIYAAKEPSGVPIWISTYAFRNSLFSCH